VSLAAAAVTRWIHVSGAALLVGVFTMLLAVARPAARAGGPEAMARLGGLERQLLRLARWTLAVTVVAGCLDLWRQAGVASGLDLLPSLRATVLWSVLARTRYGAVWLLRHGLLAALGVGLLRRRVPGDAEDRSARDLEAVVLAGASLAVAAGAGHAASARTAPDVAIAADAFHLLATGGWLGALLPFALFLRWAQALPGTAGLAVAARATARFSALGVTGVAVLAVTGAYATWEQVGGVPALAGTAYGRWLLAKLGVVGLLLAVAAVNLVWLRPRLAAVARRPGRGTRPPLPRLLRQVGAEVALGGGVLAVVAVLGIITPARHAAPVWPFGFRLSWAATRDLPLVRARIAVGAAVTLLGLVALLLALLRPSRRSLVAGIAGGAVATLGVTSALRPLAVDAYPTTYLTPSVAYTAASIDRGAAIYRTECAACHGIGGYGDGPAAAGLRPPPADLTARHTADHTVGDLFWWVSHGIPGSAMPAFEDRLSPEARWDVLNFVRALAAAETARRLGPVPDPDPAVAAPDFESTTADGQSLSLRDFRGRAGVLLVFYTLPGSAERLRQLSGRARELGRLGVEIVGVPLVRSPAVTQGAADARWGFPVVVEGAEEARAAYTLFRRDRSPAGLAPEPLPPRHMELLVDRQGYLRARWIAEAGGGWGDVTRLVAQIERLATERPKAPPPDEHVH
jgi:putative copper export protein/mono/diheme cytochrome c family protein/peroxiredoxin